MPWRALAALSAAMPPAQVPASAIMPAVPIDLPGERLFPESVSIAPDRIAYVGSEGRIDRVTVAGDHAEIRTLADGISDPTGVDVQGGQAWYVQGHLSYLFSPARRGQSPELPFRLTPVRLAP